MLLLFSGGMDSYIAYHYLNKPKTLYIDIGHKYNKQELDTVKKLIPETIYNNRLYLGDIEKENAHIPMRNAYLLMIASEYENNWKNNYKDSKPYSDAIAKINKLYDEGNEIIIYTARHSEDYDITKKQLRDWNVKYHKLITDKIGGGIYVDNNSMRIKDL